MYVHIISVLCPYYFSWVSMFFSWDIQANNVEIKMEYSTRW